jgi:hypothetical protein
LAGHGQHLRRAVVAFADRARPAAQAWTGPAAAEFAHQIGRIQKTLTDGRDAALANATTWRHAADQAQATQEVVRDIWGQYQTALGQARSDYDRKKQDADNSIFGFLTEPDPVKVEQVRKPFDQQARAVIAYTDGVYGDSALVVPPPYDGPARGGTVTAPDSSGTDHRGSSSAALLGGAALVAGSGLATVGSPQLPIDGPHLAGSAPTPTLPASPGGAPAPGLPGPGRLPTSNPASFFPPSIYPGTPARCPPSRPARRCCRRSTNRAFSDRLR